MASEFDELRRRREERRQKQLARQKRKKWLPLLIAVPLLILGGILLTVLLIHRTPSRPQTPSVPATTPDQVPPDRVIRFTAAGDLNITDDVVNAGLQDSGYEYSDIFTDILPVLSQADITALNLEGNIYGTDYGSDNACAPSELLRALHSSGVDLIQTANSKTVTNGLLGMNATMQAIQAAGMTSVGTFASEEEFNRSGGYLLWEINGIRIAIVAFTKGLERGGLPDDHCVNLLYTDYASTTYQEVDEEGITAILKNAQAAKPDITIAMLHWGGQTSTEHSKTQSKIVSIMAENGVDAIIGTHSHHVQQAGFDKDTGIFIAYSLGGLLGNPTVNYSVILSLEITKNGVTGQTRITGYDYTPVYARSSEGQLQLLRIREAIAAYESNYLFRVTAEEYQEMKAILAKLESLMQQ